MRRNQHNGPAYYNTLHVCWCTILLGIICCNLCTCRNIVNTLNSERKQSEESRRNAASNTLDELSYSAFLLVIVRAILKIGEKVATSVNLRSQDQKAVAPVHMFVDCFCVACASSLQVNDVAERSVYMIPDELAFFMGRKSVL